MKFFFEQQIDIGLLLRPNLSCVLLFHLQFIGLWRRGREECQQSLEREVEILFFSVFLVDRVRPRPTNLPSD